MKRKRLGYEALERRELLAVTTDDPGNHVVARGAGFDGVVSYFTVESGPNSDECSGALLSQNRGYVLSAAHCIAVRLRGTVNPILFAPVKFELPQGDAIINGVGFTVHPTFFDQNNIGGDLSLIRLDTPGPVGLGFDLFRVTTPNVEIGQTVTRVGYGVSGFGQTGMNPTQFPFGVKRSVMNRYEMDHSQVYADERCRNGQPPVPNLSLAYDFDNGLSLNDAFGFVFGATFANLGLGSPEGGSAPGDSGGPNFINNKIAGVTSLGTRCGMPPDVDNLTIRNASFGEYGVDTRVSAFASWIDQITTPPKVSGVTVGSTGTQPDYSVPANGTGEQRKTLPLFNAGAVNEFKVKFTEGVTVQSSHLSVRPVGGSNLAIQTFVAPSAGNNFTGTWVTSAGLGAGFFELELSNNIVDADGNRLDGEWTNPTSATQTSGASSWPSGDGTNGTYVAGAWSSFKFQFVIQPGDVNRDNVVDIVDLNIVRNNFGATTPANTLVAEWEFGNMNWPTNQDVDISDLNAVRNNFGASWIDGGQMMMSGGGGAIGEEALRAALRDLYLETLSSPAKSSPYDDLFGWDLLGDADWWKVTLGEL